MKPSSLAIAKLRIKAKSLAEEARIIRHEASKFHGMSKWELNHHRQTTVRDEARATYLTLALARGRGYLDIEAKVHDEHHFHMRIKPRLLSMAERYFGIGEEEVNDWLSGRLNFNRAA